MPRWRGVQGEGEESKAQVFISSVRRAASADVEILAHGYVHEAAHVAQRPRDVALALHVLGKMRSPAGTGCDGVARLELEDAEVRKISWRRGAL